MGNSKEGKEIISSQEIMKGHTTKADKHDVMISYDISEIDESFYDEIYNLINDKRSAERITKSNYKFNEKLKSDEIENLKTELYKIFKSKINESLKKKQTKVSLLFADDNLLKEEIIIDEIIN